MSVVQDKYKSSHDPTPNDEKDFDGIAARAEYTVETLFAKLRHKIESDVSSVNELEACLDVEFKDINNAKFAVQQLDSVDPRLLVKGVVFNLDAGRIVVFDADNAGKRERFAITASLRDDGVCVAKINSKEL